MSTSAALARLRKSISGRKQASESTSERFELPTWPSDKRGVPNIVLRSALFSASRKKRMLARADIAAQRPYDVRYTGPVLTQADLDVWVSLLHLNRGKPLGQRIHLTAYMLLQIQDKSDTGPNRANLYKSLTKLESSIVEICPPYAFTGALVDSFSRNESSSELVFSLSPNLAPLFGGSEFTRVDWNIRRSLANKPLSQWLHGYIASHAAPYPMTFRAILQMAGSTDQCAASAVQNLHRAMQSLAVTCARHQQPISFSMCEGKLHIRKTPSGSQRRHLARKPSVVTA